MKDWSSDFRECQNRRLSDCSLQRLVGSEDTIPSEIVDMVSMCPMAKGLIESKWGTVNASSVGSLIRILTYSKSGCHNC